MIFDNQFIIYLLICLFIMTILLSKKNLEHYADPYSIDMQAEAINKMKRWNIYSSRKYSSLNNYIYDPVEYRCYYTEY